MADAAGSVIKTMLTWWLSVPSINLEGEDSVVMKIRGLVLPIAFIVAFSGIIWQGTRMALSRKPAPLIDIGRGMWHVALWSAIGVFGPATALKAGDAFSTWVLSSPDGDMFGKRLTNALTMAYVSNPGLTIILGIIVILAAIVQTFLLMFREGSVIILSGVIVLAASGQFTTATRPWLRKIIGWGVALICWKPAAALVYKVGFVMIGSGKDTRVQFMGLAVLLLAIIAMPALMKFFTWAPGAIESSGGGLATGLAAAGGAMHAASWLGGGGGAGGGGGGGSSPVDHARWMQRSMPSGAKPGTGSGDVGGSTNPQSPQPPKQGAAPGKPAASAPAAQAPGGPAAKPGGLSAPGANAAAAGKVGGGTAAAGPAGVAVAAGQALASGAKSAADATTNAATKGGDK
ncbi:hypothetical protein [Longispora fulva]|uniref:TrbL/VirB6 plasmid conjugal transfer protein n=1 Tax=Longispora fulva TaxID=619741 RepID=A0A8J7GWZ5_9ACTN|nr:hypothetical protein [Longispora fulva]MBG6140504.1 hypothetical protein [Longispora fulva]